MKTMKAVAFLLTTAAVTLSGCVTPQATKDKQRALVCPQCKMVAVRTIQPSFGNSARAGWAGVPRPTTVYEDQCPGCQGAIETFFREGKWKHKCSVCKNTPYTCPVFHPL